MSKPRKVSIQVRLSAKELRDIDLALEGDASEQVTHEYLRDKLARAGGRAHLKEKAYLEKWGKRGK